jgi:hypothetical protein
MASTGAWTGPSRSADLPSDQVGKVPEDLACDDVAFVEVDAEAFFGPHDEVHALKAIEGEIVDGGVEQRPDRLIVQPGPFAPLDAEKDFDEAAFNV